MVFGLFGRKSEEMEEVFIGSVIHYFSKVKAAVVRIEKDSVSIGDRIRIKGHTTDFGQKVESMQIDHEPVEKASRKKEVAIKVKKKTRRGDRVFIERSV